VNLGRRYAEAWVVINDAIAIRPMIIYHLSSIIASSMVRLPIGS